MRCMSHKVIESPCGPIVHGLEDVLVKTTEISDIDGERGVLWYRGYRIEDIAERATYEEVVYLLLYGRLPTRAELRQLADEMAEERELPGEAVELIRIMSRAHPMFVLPAVVNVLGSLDPEANRTDEQSDIRKAIRIASKLPTAIAYHLRMSRGLDIVRPRKDLGHSANLVYMMLGREPAPLETRGMDLYLVLHADHEIPASTFTGLVAASTLTDMYSAIAAALAALKGPLHGGANEAALRQHREIGSPERVPQYVEDALRTGRRIMGVGHRVYKAYDPRAKIYKAFTRQYVEKYGDPEGIYGVAEALERYILGHEYYASRRLYPNIDFWSGIFWHYLGIPEQYFTPIFAASRVVGWAAHIVEYRRNNRIFRPRACYVGPHDLKYVPIEERG